jgi:glycerol-3-phosphate acyltransferase PlsX
MSALPSFSQHVIALDAMGGDHGPDVVVPGAQIALDAIGASRVRFIFTGDQARIIPLLQARPELERVSEVIHTDIAVSMHDKPSQALRTGRRVSSMWMAIDAVKQGKAHVAVSAGNTGALMAMSKVCLRTMADIERPAIAAIWPTLRGRSIVLDVGATIGADASHYVDMSLMGAAMARIVLGVDKPTIGLLNVGVEEIKGVEAVKEAARVLKEANIPHLSYHGFVEGDDLGKGTVDVVVIEGFAGNIALKTAEGTAKQIATYLRESINSSWLSKLGYVLASKAFGQLKERMDPRNVNGGVFLGLEGVVIKSHGGTDAIGFASAIKLAHAMAEHDLLARIREMLEQTPQPEEI